MKKISILLLLIISFLLCRNVDKEESEREKKKLITSPIFPLWLLGQRDKNEDPDCGGDVIGTLFGLNNYRRKYTKLEENQELTGEDFDLYYQSALKTTIKISLIEVTQADPNVLKDCSKPGSIVISYCNGIYRLLNFRNSSFQLNEVFQFEPKMNIKNFIDLGKNTNDCNTIYKIKSEVQP